MILPAVGVLAIGTLLATVLLGLGLTPPDVEQGEYVRLLYVHPPIAGAMYIAVAVTALASALYLWPRTRHPRWDAVAASSAEIGVLFCALTLATGSIWGRVTWGVWWTWDARLTTTALLFTMFLGYLALRRVPADAGTRAKRSAVAALVAFVDVPVVHFSVKWWRTLHQEPTLLRPDPQIAGSQLWTMVLGFVAMTLVYAWLLAHRVRVERLEADREDAQLRAALAARRAEAAAVVAT